MRSAAWIACELAMIALLAVPRVAGAGGGVAALALAREPTRMLGGRLRVRLPAEMRAAPGRDGATLDWGGTRFAIAAADLGRVAGDDVRACADADLRARGVAAASIHPLAVARPGLAWLAIPRVPRLGERTLVAAAYAVGPGGRGEVLAFYVDDAGADELAAWRTLARRIARTIIAVARGPDRVGVRVVEVRPQPTLLSHLHVRVPTVRGACRVQLHELDGAPDPQALAAKPVPGRLLGQLVYWRVWKDRSGYHAEVRVGSPPWGRLHVRCSAATARGLEVLRKRIEGRR